MRRYINFWHDHRRILMATIVITTIVLVVNRLWAYGLMLIMFANQFARGDTTLDTLRLIDLVVLPILIVQVLSMVAVLEVRYLALTKPDSLRDRATMEALIIGLLSAWFVVSGTNFILPFNVAVFMDNPLWYVVALRCLWGVSLLGAIVGMQITIRGQSTTGTGESASDLSHVRGNRVRRYGGQAVLTISLVLLIAMLWGGLVGTWFAASLSILVFSVLGVIALIVLRSKGSIEHGSPHDPAVA